MKIIGMFKGRNTLRNISIISLLSALGMIAGMGMLMLLASLTGISDQTDAFFVAYTIPAFVNLAIASSNYAFVSVFAKAVAKISTEETFKVFNVVLSIGTIILLGTSLFGYFFAPITIQLLAPGVNDQTSVMAVKLLRILVWTPLFVGLGSIANAILNAKQHFTIAAASQLVRFSGAIIGALFFPAGGAFSISIGLVIGAFIQVIMAVFACYYQIDYTIRPSLDYNLPPVIEIGHLSWAAVRGMLIWQGTPVTDRLFASFLQPGSISLIQYSSQFTGPVNGVFFSSVIAATMPSIASNIAEGNNAEVNRLLYRTGKLIGIIAIPLVALMLSLNYPLMSLFLQRGAFDQTDVSKVVPIAQIYSLSLLFYGYIVFQNAFLNATNNGKGLVDLFLKLTGLDILIKSILFPIIGPIASGVSFSVSMCVIAIISLNRMSKDRGMLLKDVLFVDINLLFAGLLMGMSAYGMTVFVRHLMPENGQLTNLLSLVLGGIIGVIILGVYLLLFQRKKH